MWPMYPFTHVASFVSVTTAQTDELLDEVKYLQLHIRGLPRRVRDWGLYREVDEKVVNLSTVLPLVSFA